MAALEAPDVYISLTRAAELAGRRFEILRVQAVRGRLRTIKTGGEHLTTRRWLHEYLLRAAPNGSERFLPLPADYVPPE
jgi:hypothetical protein